jgi:hypothetical protein
VEKQRQKAERGAFPFRMSLKAIQLFVERKANLTAIEIETFHDHDHHLLHHRFAVCDYSLTWIIHENVLSWVSLKSTQTVRAWKNQSDMCDELSLTST